MKPVFTLPDEQFARVAGVDALAYVRYLKLCLKIAAFVTLIAFGALLPTNMTSDFVSKELRRQARLGCELEEDKDAVAVRLALFHCFSRELRGSCSAAVSLYACMST